MNLHLNRGKAFLLAHQFGEKLFVAFFAPNTGSGLIRVKYQVVSSLSWLYARQNTRILAGLCAHSDSASYIESKEKYQRYSSTPFFFAVTKKNRA